MDTDTVEINGVKFQLAQLSNSELVNNLRLEYGAILALRIEKCCLRDLEDFLAFLEKGITPSCFVSWSHILGYLGIPSDSLIARQSEIPSMTVRFQMLLLHGNLIDPPVLLRENYDQLSKLGHDPEKILPFVDKDELLPFPVDAAFEDRFRSLSPVLELLEYSEDIGYVVAGGALVTALNLTGEFNPHPSTDLDFFTYEPGGNNLLIEEIKKRWVCRCYTAGSVTTIFIRDHERQIQIVDCSLLKNSKVRKLGGVLQIDEFSRNRVGKVISSFDLPCCKICWWEGHVYASPDFHILARNHYVLSLARCEKEGRIEKYRLKGVNIKINSTLIDRSFTTANSLEKYHCYQNETDEQLTKIVKERFSETYNPTILPLEQFPIFWQNQWQASYSSAPDDVEIDPLSGMSYYLDGGNFGGKRFPARPIIVDLGFHQITIYSAVETEVERMHPKVEKSGPDAGNELYIRSQSVQTLLHKCVRDFGDSANAFLKSQQFELENLIPFRIAIKADSSQCKFYVNYIEKTQDEFLEAVVTGKKTHAYLCANLQGYASNSGYCNIMTRIHSINVIRLQ